MPRWNLQLGNMQGYRKAAEVAHRSGSTSLRLIYCRTVTEKFSKDEDCFKAAKESLSHCKPQQDNLQHLHHAEGAHLVLLLYSLANVAAALPWKLQTAQNGPRVTEQKVIMMVSKLQNKSISDTHKPFKNSTCSNNRWVSEPYFFGF